MFCAELCLCVFLICFNSHKLLFVLTGFNGICFRTICYHHSKNGAHFRKIHYNNFCMVCIGANASTIFNLRVIIKK
jgi:hypothetical protein